MGHGEAAGLTVDGGYGCQDLLANLEAVLRAGDPGDGDPLQREHGDDAAANIQKRPERHQMGHHCSDHRTGDQRFQKGVQSPLLGGPTAQQRHGSALFVGPDVRDHKAGRLSHPG